MTQVGPCRRRITVAALSGHTATDKAACLCVGGGPALGEDTGVLLFMKNGKSEFAKYWGQYMCRSPGQSCTSCKPATPTH